MAIDTRAKRASAASLVAGWLMKLPPPDGAIGQADRQHVACCYRGILSAEPGDVHGHMELTYTVTSITLEMI